MLFQQTSQFIVILTTKMSESTSLSVVVMEPRTDLAQEAIEYEFLSVFHADSQLEITCDTKPLSPFYVFRRQQSSAFSVHAFPAHSTSSHSEL